MSIYNLLNQNDYNIFANNIQANNISTSVISIETPIYNSSTNVINTNTTSGVVLLSNGLTISAGQSGTVILNSTAINTGTLYLTINILSQNTDINSCIIFKSYAVSLGDITVITLYFHNAGTVTSSGFFSFGFSVLNNVII